MRHKDMEIWTAVGTHDWKALSATRKKQYQNAARNGTPFVTGREPPRAGNGFAMPPLAGAEEENTDDDDDEEEEEDAGSKAPLAGLSNLPAAEAREEAELLDYSDQEEPEESDQARTQQARNRPKLGGKNLPRGSVDAAVPLMGAPGKRPVLGGKNLADVKAGAIRADEWLDESPGRNNKEMKALRLRLVDNDTWAWEDPGDHDMTEYTDVHSESRCVRVHNFQ
jgi:hypothetical protein